MRRVDERLLPRDIGRIVAEDVEDPRGDGDLPRGGELVGADLEQRPVVAARNPERPEAELLQLRRALAHVARLAEAQLAAPDADPAEIPHRSGPEKCARGPARSARRRVRSSLAPSGHRGKDIRSSRSATPRIATTEASQEQTVPTNLYLVFSKRPEAISAAEYDRWYEAHAQENIESPGFLNARRFELTPSTGNARAVRASRGLRVRGRPGALAHRPQPAHRERRHQPAQWFPQIQFGSWDCQPASGLLQPARPAR